MDADTSTATSSKPPKSTSTILVRVRFNETDLMGVVHHGSYLVYFEAARVEWLRRRGGTYADFAARDLHLPVVEAHLTYRAPSHFDDVLEVETTLSELRVASMRFTYRIHRGGVLIADGWTRLACIDQTRKPIRIPEEMRGVLLARESPQCTALHAP
jgi:acyl-CoA thioester hydrolase